LAACSDDAGTGPVGDVADAGDDAVVETDAANDVLTPDVGVDVAEDAEADAMSDVGPDPSCQTVSVAGLPSEPVYKALADAPARCGQAAHQWVNDARLGDIVSKGLTKSYSAAAIQALAAQEGIVLPFELKYDVKVTVIEYVTQDRGQLTTATAFVAAPAPRADQNPDMKMLMFLHGTSGFTDGCGPSSDDTTLLLGAVIAASGYVLVGPDYLGLKGRGEPTGFLHPYLVGQSVAMSSLDAARAVVKMDLTQQGTCLNDDLLVLGGSQGGHAALWVDRLLPYYAPEFELLGTVATVPPADLYGQLQRALTAPVEASANTAAFYAASAHWYGLDSRLNEVLASPYDVELPAAMAASCNPGDQIEFPNVPALEDVFAASFLAKKDTLDQDPEWGCMAVENGLTTTSVARVAESDRYADTYGIMWVMGEQDALVNTPIERGAFAELCSQGMSDMYYLECAGASHTGATAQALPQILTFLNQRAAREALPTTGKCELTAPVACQQ
jgi:hypothetical protein